MLYQSVVRYSFKAFLYTISMKYTCPRCKYTTDKKCHMVSHIERKYPCEPLYQKVLVTDIHQCQEVKQRSFPCRYNCGKSFNHESSESRHHNTCPLRINSGKKSKEGTHVTVAHSQQTQVIQGGENHINNQLSQVTVNITPFSDMSPGITYAQFVQFMKKGALNTILKAIEEEHFNPDKPEQMNIYISNLKDKIGRVFENDKWEVCDSDRLNSDVYEMYRSVVCRMVEDTGDNEEEVRKKLGNKYPELEAQINRWEKQVRPIQFDDRAIQEVNLLLYNNRGIVKETHKLRY